DDYYIATSTFEWFPGVLIHHSRDLRHWRPLTYALDRVSQLDLRGVATAHGVWAPCLSYDKRSGLFYLVYTIVYGMNGRHFDLDNFIVTAPDIRGPWSEPRYVNSTGFDPSLFHDDDGQKWVVNLEWETRDGYEHPGWIVLQKWSVEQERLVGRPKRISRGATDRGCLEAPHLYKHGGYYYLMTAEGGTGYGHAVAMARSRTIEGPYEPDPAGPLITSHVAAFDERGVDDSPKLHRFQPGLELQKAGHGSLVETGNGEWYVAHLCARPLLPDPVCILGRETALQKCVWTEDGWLRMAEGGPLAAVETPAPDLPEHPFPSMPVRDDFDEGVLGIQYQTYRVPADSSWLSFDRPGYLRMRGRGSIFSPRQMSLVARRLQAFRVRVETGVEFEPWHVRQSAGLTAFYSAMNFYYLRIYHSESLGVRCLGIMKGDLGRKSELRDARVPIEGWPRVYLRFILDHRELQFFYSSDGVEWKKIGPVLDATILSDEYGFQKFTGAFAGLFVQDLHTQELWADFDYFDYEELA
ncbi:MAG: glycoside hydrolase family 43 protein, partial [Verrucomicrobia bacterium]